MSDSPELEADRLWSVATEVDVGGARLVSASSQLPPVAWRAFERAIRAERRGFGPAGQSIRQLMTEYTSLRISAAFTSAGLGRSTNSSAPRGLSPADLLVREFVAASGWQMWADSLSADQDRWTMVLDYPLPTFGSPPYDWTSIGRQAVSGVASVFAIGQASSGGPVMAVASMAAISLLWYAKPLAEEHRQHNVLRVRRHFERKLRETDNAVAGHTRSQPDTPAPPASEPDNGTHD